MGRVDEAVCLARTRLATADIFDELTNTAIPQSTTAIAESIPTEGCTWRKIQEVSIPEIGTSSESGAADEAGYLFIKLFHVIYPRIVVT